MFPPYRGQKINWKVFDEMAENVYRNNSLLEKLKEAKPKEKLSMLFEIAVTKKAEGDKRETVVVEITSIVAKDKAAAERIAIKKIPEGVDLDEVTVLVRPFV